MLPQFFGAAPRQPLMGRGEAIRRGGDRSRDRIFSDFGNFYRSDVLANYGIALIGGGIMANSKMDLHFQRWYRRQVHCGFTNDFGEFSKIFGEGKIFIPVAVASALVYRCRQERFGTRMIQHPIGEFFDRTARGYAVGAPTLLFFQYALGGDRPRDGGSYWKPFQGEDHSISGHAYIGAIPFITAAHMTDQVWAKGLFYTLSVIPTWSRIDSDAHYFSQAVLGWYLAYLSVRAVSETESQRKLPKGLTIFPVAGSEGVGIGFQYRR